MAEIKIEKKSPIWPWILLVIVVIAIIAYFVYNNNNEDNSIYDKDVNSERMDTDSNTYEESTAPLTGSTNTVQEFEDSVKDSTRIGKDSTYTKTAIINLAKAVSMKADELNLQPSIALEKLRYYSDQSNGMSNSELPEGSDVINLKTVSNDIVAVLETIQTESYPALQDEVADLKQTSDKIENNMETKEQQSTIQAFFSKAKKVINNMNT